MADGFCDFAAILAGEGFFDSCLSRSLALDCSLLGPTTGLTWFNCPALAGEWLGLGFRDLRICAQVKMAGEPSDAREVIFRFVRDLSAQFGRLEAHNGRWGGLP